MTTNPVPPPRPSTDFDAGVDQLTYDFTAYIADAKGVIPEPSSQQMETFLEYLRQIMPTKEGADGKTVIDLDKLSETFEKGAEIEAVLNTACAGVCSDTPSAEQIAALPYRVKQRFYGWLTGSLLSPEA